MRNLRKHSLPAVLFLAAAAQSLPGLSAAAQSPPGPSAAAQSPSGAPAPADAGGFGETAPPEIQLLPPKTPFGPASPPQGEGPDEAGTQADPLLAGVNRELDRMRGVPGAPTQEAPPPGPARALGFSYYAKVFSGLCFVLALILIVGYAARRLGRKTPLLAGAGLGEILGRLHLARGVSLHFVRTGGRVLVVGVTSNALSLVAEFAASAFEGEAPDAALAGEGPRPGPFLAQLRESAETLSEPAARGDEDDEIASLRGDIQRLQRYLKEESRGPRE